MNYDQINNYEQFINDFMVNAIATPRYKNASKETILQDGELFYVTLIKYTTLAVARG